MKITTIIKLSLLYILLFSEIAMPRAEEVMEKVMEVVITVVEVTDSDLTGAIVMDPAVVEER